MIYYTADLHTDHKNIINICKRPFPNVDEMEAELVKRWNAKVTPKDHIYVLGDIMFKPMNFQAFIGKVNGNIHYLSGNHDADVWQRNRKNDIPNVTFHQQIHEIRDFVDGKEHKVVLCHYPIMDWNGRFHGSIHLHGHCHGNIGASFTKNAYDVGVDVRAFSPVSLEELIKI